MSDTNDVPMSPEEVDIVNRAMQWYEKQWPFDPEAQSYAPPPYFKNGEVLPPKVEVHHHEGWLIGRIYTEDGLSKFVRDYVEDGQ